MLCTQDIFMYCVLHSQVQISSSPLFIPVYENRHLRLSDHTNTETYFFRFCLQVFRQIELPLALTENKHSDPDHHVAVVHQSRSNHAGMVKIERSDKERSNPGAQNWVQTHS